MLDPRDETLERIVRELRRLPPSDPVAVQAIVVAAERDRAHRPIIAPDVTSLWRTPRFSLAAAAALILLAGAGGFALRGVRAGASSVAILPAPAIPETAPVSFATQAAAADGGADGSLQQTQFVIEAPNAQRVALVGSFNDWDAHATPLVRTQADGVWSVSVPLTQGRHRYAFIVNDSVWTLDPRGLRAPDGDFGIESSVLIVGRGEGRQ